MSDDTDYDAEQDQDSEPTMTAPEEGRPDGLDALHPDQGQSTSAVPDEDREAGGQPPEDTDAEVLVAQQEESPADE
jgi:hypothetical protein